MESLPTKSTNVEKCRVHLEDGLPVWHAGAPPVEREGVNTRISFSLEMPFNQNLSTSLLRLNPLGPRVDHGSHTVRSNLGPLGVMAPNQRLINDQMIKCSTLLRNRTSAYWAGYIGETSQRHE